MVLRAVASDTRGLQFESSHRENLFVPSTEKTKIKKKRPGIAQLKKLKLL